MKILLLISLFAALLSCSRKTDEAANVAIIVAKHYSELKFEQEIEEGTVILSLSEVIDVMNEHDAELVRRNIWRITELKPKDVDNGLRDRNVFIIKNDSGSNIVVNEFGIVALE